MEESVEKRARRHLEAGLRAIHQGNLRLARDHFRASTTHVLSADALTYWGWMEHNLGNTQLAIDLCHQAIAVDPDFGNPYNDIGSYLVSQGNVDEAIGWFEKAVHAKRYEPRQFPHINLGKLFLDKKMPIRALKEFKKALEFAPGDPEIEETISKIQKSLN